ncbi:hypothetical protein FACS18942_08680 [Planctomycetales bacterium]|nr:hypothetical protein FACS18942_08680 [Planctomycetales bacterium]GHT38090.1 hypothetical protein FACS189427_11930 [Planctomycetales bacterium]
MSFTSIVKRLLSVSLFLLFSTFFLTAFFSIPQLSAQEQVPQEKQQQIQKQVNPKQAAARKQDTSWKFEPNPKLPNVLILGDSISIGYTRNVRERLQERANVYRPMKSETAVENCAYTAHGLENLDKYLGNTKWSVIVFNWGLHDLAYVAEKGINKQTGKQRYPIEVYEKNLDAIVKKLKTTGAKLVWASTTLVPEGEPGRKAEDAPRYNAAAEKVMKENGIQILDLYSITEKFTPELFTKPGNVHYSPKGYSILGEKVAETIRENL